MNENNWNEQENPVSEGAECNELPEKESAECQVKFNEDGTYSGGVNAQNEEQTTVKEPSESEAALNDAINNFGSRNVNPYSHQNTSSENRGSSYPYGNADTTAQNQVNNNTSSYPYNASYPYGSSNQGNNSVNGSYPYGNYNSGNNSASGSYPYGNNNYGGYAYPSSDKGGKKKSKGGKIFAVVAGALAVFLVAALAGIAMGGNDTKTELPEPTTGDGANNVEEFVTNASPVTGNEVNSEGEMNPKNIFKKVLESSVGILVYEKTSKALASEGSGVLFQESEDGRYTYIVTCAHVINGSSSYIRVQLHDGKEYDAEVVGFDVRTDIGVIRVEKTGFTLAEIGDSSKIEVGDPIYAIGNPGGVEFANSFTNGMVSALDRPVSSSSTGYTTECIQHTAAINPGNSGGALVNAFGQIIGINSMKIVDDEYEGMGFAVPSSVFVEIVNEIMKNGYVSNRPKLGITYVPASEYSSYGMYVAIKGLPTGSIVIYEITNDSALVGTKVKAGDMITAVNGIGLETASFLSEYIENLKVGDEITLSIVRINNDYTAEEFEVTVTLVEDRGDSFAEEEVTTGSQLPGGNYGGNYGGSYGGSYEDYFNQFFEDFFNGMR